MMRLWVQKFLIKKSFIVGFLFLSFIPLTTATVVYSKSEKSLHAQNPDYAKWGKIAMNATKQKYPSALIVDYKYMGHQELAANQAVDTFKLWLQQDKREWGVYVQILHSTISGQVLAIKFQESSR